MGDPPTPPDCQSTSSLTRASDPFKGRTGMTVGHAVAVGSGNDLDVSARCGSSYYQGTTPCDATYDVWHCGSSYSQGFVTCPPGTPGALPPIQDALSRAAVQVAGGQTTIAPHRTVTLKLPLTAAARAGVRTVEAKVKRLARTAAHAGAARKRTLEKRIATLRAVHFEVRVTNTQNGAAQTIRLTVKVPT